MSVPMDAGTKRARPLLDVVELATWFRGRSGTVRAVDGVSFSLNRGETLGIVGESGSGKSVLARSIMRLLPRSALNSSGAVYFDGHDLHRLDRRALRRLWGARIAIVLQDPMRSLNPVKPIGRQIVEPIRVHLGQGRAEARSRAIELLDRVGIPDATRRFSAYPHELSGGMRQRVSIAIALSCSPDLLIADEPTTALDVTIQQQILDLLQSLQHERGMALILITHDLGVAAGRTDRIAVMYGGRIVETGQTMTLFAEPRHPYSEALLGAIPRLDHRSHTRLRAIPGNPATGAEGLEACQFAPRCRYAGDRCREEVPQLQSAATAIHRFACFNPVGSATSGTAARREVAARPTGGPLAQEALAVEVNRGR